MKKIHRFFAVVATSVLGVAATVAFTGCETNQPELTITYGFNGTEYKVEYVLSRKGAPQTVRHFIELADAGYYDGMVIHDYQSSGAFLYGGAYTWNEDEEEIEKKLEERDYWTWVKNYEAENDYTFTQSVYTSAGDPLYTVYGEFSDNGCTDNARKFTHSYTTCPGALVMVYTEKGNDTTRVSVTRSDDGSLQGGNPYKYNSATSMFYTWTGTGTRSDLDDKYCVFGHAKDYTEIQDLLDAIRQYETDNLSGEEETFTEEVTISNVNEYDLIDVVRNSKIPATYSVPVEPIYIKSVKVTKY